MQEKLRKRANKAVDPIALETWINQTLHDAQLAEIKGAIKKVSQQKKNKSNSASN